MLALQYTITFNIFDISRHIILITLILFTRTLNQQLEKNMKTAFAGRSKSSARKEEKKNEINYKSLCVTCKRNKHEMFSLGV